MLVASPTFFDELETWRVDQYEAHCARRALSQLAAPCLHRRLHDALTLRIARQGPLASLFCPNLLFDFACSDDAGSVCSFLDRRLRLRAASRCSGCPGSSGDSLWRPASRFAFPASLPVASFGTLWGYVVLFLWHSILMCCWLLLGFAAELRTWGGVPRVSSRRTWLPWSLGGCPLAQPPIIRTQLSLGGISRPVAFSAACCVRHFGRTACR